VDERSGDDRARALFGAPRSAGAGHVASAAPAAGGVAPRRARPSPRGRSAVGPRGRIGMVPAGQPTWPDRRGLVVPPL